MNFGRVIALPESALPQPIVVGSAKPRFSGKQTSAQVALEAAIQALEFESDNVYSSEIASLNADLIAPALRKILYPVESKTGTYVDVITEGRRASNLLHHTLTAFERREILTYREVYYAGQNADKPVLSSANCNNGFDDADNVYKYVPNDHMEYRYELLKQMGSGAFGQVYKAYDHKEKRNVALKVLKNEDKAKRLGVTEQTMLNNLAGLEGSSKARITTVARSFVFRSHMTLVMDLCAMDMVTLLGKRENKLKGLSMVTVRKIALGALRSLKFLSDHHVVHCDLKLENILLVDPSRTGIKICDFNTSCVDTATIYSYLQSRHYRAPEVTIRIRNQKYGLPIDMWSIGCCLAELYTGSILFPGENEADMMAMFMELFGIPSAKFLALGADSDKYVAANGVPVYCKAVPSPYGGMVVKSGGVPRRLYRGVPGSKRLGATLGLVDENAPFVDFLRRCLEWEPEVRLTPAEALLHPWMLYPPK